MNSGMKGQKNNSYRVGQPAERKRDRRKAAEARQAEHDKLSMEEKLDKAILRGGENCKEAVRLRAQIACPVIQSVFSLEASENPIKPKGNPKGKARKNKSKEG